MSAYSIVEQKWGKKTLGSTSKLVLPISRKRGEWPAQDSSKPSPRAHYRFELISWADSATYIDAPSVLSSDLAHLPM